MKIALGADHGGYELKEKIKQYLSIRKGIELIDFNYESYLIDYQGKIILTNFLERRREYEKKNSVTISNFSTFNFDSLRKKRGIRFF